MIRLEPFIGTENRFKDIEAATNEMFETQSQDDTFRISAMLLTNGSRPRCLATFLFGRMTATSPQSLGILRSEVSREANWRAQEILAKTFDRYCADVGYEGVLPVIEDWLSACLAGST